MESKKMAISFINPNLNSCTVTCGTNVVCRDKGNPNSEVRLQNNQGFEILKHIVDDCLIQQGQRCDFLLEIKKLLSDKPQNSQKVEDYDYREYYIETKGSNVEKAYEQILATVPQLTKVTAACLNSGQHQRKGFIVCTSVPKMTTTIQNLKSRAKRDYKMEIAHQSRVFEINDFK